MSCELLARKYSTIQSIWEWAHGGSKAPHRARRRRKCSKLCESLYLRHTLFSLLIVIYNWFPLHYITQQGETAFSVAPSWKMVILLNGGIDW